MQVYSVSVCPELEYVTAKRKHMYQIDGWIQVNEVKCGTEYIMTA